MHNRKQPVSKTNFQSHVLTCVFIFVFAFECQAQFSLGYTFFGDHFSDRFGQSVSGVGDVNGDGVDDFIVGAPGSLSGSSFGFARVFSGIDGAVLHTFYADSLGDNFGASVSGAGDVNGDGFHDMIIGAQNASDFGQNSGSARVVSGGNFATLYTFHGDSAFDIFGFGVSGVGDVDGDGFDDVMVGAPADDNNGINSGSAKVFSGVDGSILYSLNGDAAGDRFGTSVSGAGDLNGDGCDDFMVGSPLDDTNGVNTGKTQVFSGLDGTIIFTLFGDPPGGAFGFLSCAGDVNNDGVDDFIVSAPTDDTNGMNSGSAKVFSGDDGSILFSLNGDNALDRFGSSVSRAGDVNGDGFDDFLVGIPLDDNNGTSSGSARVYSGIDGSIITTYSGQVAFSCTGNDVDGLGDINGDGFDDVIVGSKFGDGLIPSRVHVLFADTLPVLHFETETGLPHFLDLEWQPDNGDVYSKTGKIHSSGATPGGVGLIGASLAELDTVLFGYLPLLIANGPTNLTILESFTYGPFGKLTTNVDRQNPILAGNQIFVQSFQISPLVLSSNGLRLLIEP